MKLHKNFNSKNIPNFIEAVGSGVVYDRIYNHIVHLRLKRRIHRNNAAKVSKINREINRAIGDLVFLETGHAWTTKHVWCC